MPEQKLALIQSWQQDMGPLFNAGLTQLSKEGMPTEAYLASMMSELPAYATTAKKVLLGKAQREANKTIQFDYDTFNGKFRDMLGKSALLLPPKMVEAMADSALSVHLMNGNGPKVRTNVDDAIREVLGGSPGNNDQGVSYDQTILPPGVGVDQFDDWRSKLTDGDLTKYSLSGSPPVYELAGVSRVFQPTASDIIDQGRFIMVRPGLYMVEMKSDDGVLSNPDGSIYYMRLPPSVFK